MNKSLRLSPGAMRALASFMGVLLASSAVAGYVSGRVIDATNGSGIEGAQIFVMTPDDRATFDTADSMGDGYFYLDAKDPGPYYVATLHADYVDQMYDGIPCPDGLCLGREGTPLIIGTADVFLEITLEPETDSGTPADWLEGAHTGILAAKVPFGAYSSGATWGWWLFSEVDGLRGYADMYHRTKGGFYHSSMFFGGDQPEALGTLDDSLACLDIDGQILRQPSGVMIPNLHHPAFRAQLIAWGREVVDAGADGMMIDGAAPNVDAIYLAGGCFEPLALESFRSYLESTYTAAELATEFGITNIETFSFKQWVIDHGVQETWYQPPLERLPAELVVHEMQFDRAFFQDFVGELKTYALDHHSRNFSVSENHSAYHTLVDIDDYLTRESFYYSPGFATTNYSATYVKIGQAIGDKPVVLLPEMYDTAEASLPTDKASNIVKFMLADIHASGGVANLDPLLLRLDGESHSYLGWYIMDREVYSNYSHFLLHREELFANRDLISSVGLVYSYTSFVNSDTVVEGGNAGLTQAIEGMSKLLIDANIQHQVIYLTDPRLHPDGAIPASFTEHDLVIVPNVFSMTDAQAEELLSYVASGGVVIATGAIGTHDERARLANRPVLQSLANGARTVYGEGIFSHMVATPGLDYLYLGQRASLDLMRNEVEHHLGVQTTVAGDRRVLLYFYKNLDGYTVHLINRDYDPNTDAFTHQANVQVGLRLPFTSCAAQEHSPDRLGIRDLATWRDDGILWVEIPFLEAYSVVTLCNDVLFADGFESGDTTTWTKVVG